LLIFGYLILIGVLFLPCQKIFYSSTINEELEIRREKIEGNQIVSFFPIIITKKIGVSKYKNFENSLRAKISAELENYKNFLNKNLADEIEADISEAKKNIERLEKEGYDRDSSFEFFFVSKKIEEYREALSSDSARNEYFERKITINAAKIREDIEKEIKDKVRDKPYYHVIKTELFISIISIILIIGGFTYILFCVVLRKEERKR